MPQRRIWCQRLFNFSVFLIVIFHVQEVYCYPNNLFSEEEGISQARDNDKGNPKELIPLQWSNSVQLSTSSSVILKSRNTTGIVQKGQPFALTCSGNQRVPLIAEEPVESHVRNGSGRMEENVFIKKATQSDENYFCCSCCPSEVYDPNCKEFQLLVREKIRATPRIAVPVTKVGDRAELQCDLDPSGYKNFNLYHIDLLWISPNGAVTKCEPRNRHFTDKKRSCNLTISNATKTDEGEYACEMTSFNFTAVARQHFIVYDHPILIAEALNSSKTEYVNKTARWVVHVQSIPNVLDYSLAKIMDHNELPVLNQSRFNVAFNDTSTPGERDYILTIDNATYSDSGDYAFALSNGISREIVDLKLVVTDNPYKESLAIVTLGPALIGVILLGAVLVSIFVYRAKHNHNSSYLKGVDKQYYKGWIYSGGLKWERVIGEGHFGVVSKQIAKDLLPHEYERSEKFLPRVKQLVLSKIWAKKLNKWVAVKSPRASTRCDCNAKLLLDKEFKIYTEKKLNHINIVTFYGVSLRNGYLELILEYCELSLLKCLQNDNIRERPLTPGYCRWRDNANVTPCGCASHNIPVNVHSFAPDAKHLVDYAGQIATGMAYLACNGVIHGDLAARNAVVKICRKDGNVRYIIKLCDFGVAHQCVRYNGVYQYQMSRSTQVPVNTKSPEVFRGNLQTSQSDVWSFGMLLWEMFFHGSREPFQNLSEAQIYQLVMKSERPDLLVRPPLAPNRIWQLMMSCWNRLPEGRPTFDQIVQILRQEGESLELS